MSDSSHSGAHPPRAQADSHDVAPPRRAHDVVMEQAATDPAAPPPGAPPIDPTLQHCGFTSAAQLPHARRRARRSTHTHQPRRRRHDVVTGPTPSCNFTSVPRAGSEDDYKEKVFTGSPVRQEEVIKEEVQGRSRGWG